MLNQCDSRATVVALTKAPADAKVFTRGPIKAITGCLSHFCPRNGGRGRGADFGENDTALGDKSLATASVSATNDPGQRP